MIEAERHLFTVAEDAAGQRLDVWLTGQLALQTRSTVRRHIENGDVTVDGKSVHKAGHALRANSEVCIVIPPPASPLPEPERIPLDVVFEDEHLIVVNKAPGMVVHPAHGNLTGTLVNALLHHCPDIQGVGGVRRPGIVHRLDKGTSGLIMAAKDDPTHAGLSNALKRREIHRRYEALVWGRGFESEWVIQGPIGRDPTNRLRMAVVANGRAATTHCELIRRGELISRLGLRLETGRTHQIRVHLRHTHHPVVGDEIYGGMSRSWIERLHRDDQAMAAAVRRIKRPMLHAAELSFTHPITDEAIELVAPPPRDFKALADRLGL